MADARRIALVTDFGVGGPYQGQMRLLLSDLVPQTPVFDLVADLPRFRPDLAAYLLPALVRDVPSGTLYICVVDPGVGGDRAAIAVEADGNWYVGPDNGLLAIVVRRARHVRILRVDWRPERLSESFHGRDLFAPIAAALTLGPPPESAAITPDSLVGAQWPDQLDRILYADQYGNLITGLLASDIPRASFLRVVGRDIVFARTFCEVPKGTAFWYENAFGLVEIAVNQGRADRVLGLAPGDAVRVTG
jgi:S-adenosylmethionine hydrolase